VIIDEAGEAGRSSRPTVKRRRRVPIGVRASRRADRTGYRQIINEPPAEPRKFYIDGGEVEVIGHLVYDLDTDGKKLQVVKYTEYSGRAVRTLYPTREALQSAWANPDTRSEVLRELTERGISFEELAASSEQPDADPFDLLCHLAWNAPLLTRRQRADMARRQTQDLFAQHGDTAREILTLLLDRYIERGILQFNALSELMKVQPFDRYGSPSEIATRHFGGVRGMKDAVSRLQTALYQ
jgi:type I restriction enzyme R subunit